MSLFLKQRFLENTITLEEYVECLDIQTFTQIQNNLLIYNFRPVGTELCILDKMGLDKMGLDEVGISPEKISVSCLDENVCLESYRKYYKENPIWYCERCTNPIHDESQASVVCDCCLNWYHFSCLDMKNPPKSKLWFCRKCYD